jgi:hypothetical protein
MPNSAQNSMPNNAQCDRKRICLAQLCLSERRVLKGTSKEQGRVVNSSRKLLKIKWLSGPGSLRSAYARSSRGKWLLLTASRF